MLEEYKWADVFTRTAEGPALSHLDMPAAVAREFGTLAKKPYRMLKGSFNQVMLYKDPAEAVITPRYKEGLPILEQAARILDHISGLDLILPKKTRECKEHYLLGITAEPGVQWHEGAATADSARLIAPSIVSTMIGLAAAFTPAQADDIIKIRNGIFPMPAHDLAAQMQDPAVAKYKVDMPAALEAISAYHALAATRKPGVYHADLQGGNILVDPATDASPRLIDLFSMDVGIPEMGFLQLLRKNGPDAAKVFYEEYGRQTGQPVEFRDLLVCAAASSLQGMAIEARQGRHAVAEQYAVQAARFLADLNPPRIAIKPQQSLGV